MLHDPMECSPPGSSVHGILWARILEWVAISFSRGSSLPSDLHCRQVLHHLSHQGSPYYVCVCVCVCVYIYIYIHMYICVYIYIHMYICTYMYIYIYIHMYVHTSMRAKSLRLCSTL